MTVWKLLQAPLVTCGLLVSTVPVNAGAASRPLPTEQTDAQDPPCIEDRSVLLALDQQAFDQTLDGGWRPIAKRPECRLAAADLIRDYRERAQSRQSAEDRETNPGRFDVLFWHEAQLRALSGETEAALALFRQAYGPHSSASWIPYAEATIAFLQDDRAGLEQARAELVALEPPDDWDERVSQMKAEYDYDLTWPPNLEVVDGLLNCLGEPYEKAYDVGCRPPDGQEN